MARVYNLTAAAFALDNIHRKRIKISRYAEVNDPFELMAGDLSDKRFREAIRKWKTDLSKTKGIICFSKSWDNPVLWSHYGDRHRGIALGFDLSDQYASEVRYSDLRLPITFIKNKPKNGLDPNFVNNLIHTKFRHWEYEQECRLHVQLDEGTQENGLYFYNFGPDLILKEIILGHSCPTPIAHVRNMIEQSFTDVDVIKSRLAFKSFRVVVDKRTKIR